MQRLQYSAAHVTMVLQTIEVSDIFTITNPDEELDCESDGESDGEWEVVEDLKEDLSTGRICRESDGESDGGGRWSKV